MSQLALNWVHYLAQWKYWTNFRLATHLSVQVNIIKMAENFTFFEAMHWKMSEPTYVCQSIDTVGRINTQNTQDFYKLCFVLVMNQTMDTKWDCENPLWLNSSRGNSNKFILLKLLLQHDSLLSITSPCDSLWLLFFIWIRNLHSTK